MTIKRRFVLSVFALSLPATALADPKKEAVDAMNWGLEYCKDALNPDKGGIDEIKDNYNKFKTRLDTAVAADPSIRTWTGQLRGMKVNEGIAKCEKEIPDRLAKAQGASATEDRDRALVNACLAGVAERSPGDWPNYQAMKADAIKKNKGPLTGEVAQKLASCEADHAARGEATKKENEELDASREKQRLAAIEEGKKRAAEEKKLRATLKGDRGKVYDTYGKPITWDGDLDKTPEWRWMIEKTHLGFTEECWTYVRFKGNKKVKEWQSGAACKW